MKISPLCKRDMNKADLLEITHFLISNKYEYVRLTSLGDYIGFSKSILGKEKINHILGYLTIHEIDWIEDFNKVAFTGYKNGGSITIRTEEGEYRDYHKLLKTVFPSARVRRLK